MDTKGIDTGGAWLLGDQDPGSWGEDAWLETWTVWERASWWWKGALLQGTETRPGWPSSEAHKDKGRQEGSAFSMMFLERKINFCEWQSLIWCHPGFGGPTLIQHLAHGAVCSSVISREGPWDTEQEWNMGGKAVDMAEAGLYRPELCFQGNWGMLLTQKKLVQPHGPHGTVSPVLYTPWRPSEDQGWHSVQ